MSEQYIIQKVKEAIELGVIPGASIAFLRNGQVTKHYLGNLGYEKYQKPLDEIMQYDIASLSKVVATTTRILQLIDEQKISFDTKINTILDCANDCTIHDLLLHCGGYPSDIENKYDCTKESLIQIVLKMTKSVEGYSYSDIGYILLGLIIQKIDQKSLEETFQEHIFKPLKMKNTSFIPNCKENCVPTEFNEKRGMIQGVCHDHKAYLLNQGGSAGIFSTLEDLSLFVNAYLTRSSLLFSKEMFACFEIEKEKRTLGWEKKYGKHTLYHTGFTGTSILMDLKNNKAMILLTNRIHPTRIDRGFLNLREECNLEFLNEAK